MNNRSNEIFPFFSLFNYKISLKNRLIDIFSNHFSFHTLNRKNSYNIKSHLQYLDNITIQALLNSLLVVIIINTSIIYSYDNPIIKTIYYIVNVMPTEAELFTIRCSIN